MPPTPPTPPTEKTMRNSSRFTFNIGYIIIIYVLFMISFALFKGTLVTQDNFVTILFTLLGAAGSFFGINVARVTTENVTAMNNTAAVSALTPPPDSTTMTTPAGGVVAVEQTGAVAPRGILPK